MSDASSRPASLSLRLFGPFVARLDGRPLPRLRSQKGQWLLALLALRHGSEVGRSWLAGLLWPESPEPQALANLRNSLTDLRQALGGEARRLLSPTPHSLMLDVTGADVDVIAFDRAVADGGEAAVAEAVELYRGPLLEGCAEEWAFQEREARQVAYLEARERLAAAAASRNEWDAAERHLRRAIAVDVTRETAQRELLRVLSASGNYAAAIHAYRELRLYLHRELNTEPDPETRTLFEQIRAAARERTVPGAQFPVLGSTAAGSRPPGTGHWVPATEHHLTGHRAPGTGHRSEATLTFLFTDIEGSTRLWEEQPDAMRLALQRHDVFLRRAIETNNGHVFKTIGDAFCAAFAAPADALDAALDAQRLLLNLAPGALTAVAGLSLQVRIALHTGAVERRDEDYFGPAVNRVARLLDLCHGGQVLLTGTTRELVQDDLPPAASLRDLGQHRLRDLQRPEHIYQLVAPGLLDDFPPPASLSTLPNNLPQQVTSFVGREREMAEVKRLLETARLVTLTGAGGTGKTRLALQIAAELLEAGGDGVWLAELAALTDGTQVPPAVATVLGIREFGGRPLRETLVDYLRPRRVLLVLDNCEHLLSACASLADMLMRHCPHLRILATSREGLNIPGETTYRLPSLSTPNPSERAPLLEYDAVRLFRDRAVAVNPSFAINDQHALAVAQICHRLDGVPLAIELAAVRVKVLTVEQIADRLDDRFRLLTGGSRTALPRQQTLRALIDWSYDLLSDPERVLLRRLSVFAGGWDLEAAEQVCSDDQRRTTNDQRPMANDVPGVRRWSLVVGREDVLDLLTALVEKSLVVYEEGESQGRYRLLETVRQYGRDRLLEAGEPNLVRQRHARYFVDRVDRLAKDALEGVPSAWTEFFAWLAVDYENCRTALEWTAGSDGESALRMAGALVHFWLARTRFEEAREWLERVLEPANAAPAALRLKPLNALGFMVLNLGETRRAAAIFGETLPLARELGDQWNLAFALLGTVATLRFQDAHEQSIHLLEEGTALARALGDRWLLSLSVGEETAMAFARGDQERLAAVVRENRALAEASGDPFFISAALFREGDAALLRQDYDTAVDRYCESLQVARDLGSAVFIAICLYGLAQVWLARGEPERAARSMAVASTTLDLFHAPMPPYIRREFDQREAAARAALGEEAFAAVWAMGRAMTLEEACVVALGEGRPPRCP